MNLHVYLHCAAMSDHWREIVAETVGFVDGSGLYDAAASLHCIVVGPNPDTRYLACRGYPKWETVDYGGWLDEYEYPTLRALWSKAKADPSACYLYLHTKGASAGRENSLGAYNGKRFRDRWRKIMLYNLVTRWRDRVEDLASCDSVGVFGVGGPFPHYSGNFWWATGEHLAKLPEPEPRDLGEPGGEHPRLWAELWIQSLAGRHRCCYDLPSCVDTAFLTDAYRAQPRRFEETGHASSDPIDPLGRRMCDQAK